MGYNLSHLIRLSQLLEKFQLPRLPSEITGKLSFLRKNTRLDEMTALLRTIERKKSRSAKSIRKEITVDQRENMADSRPAAEFSTRITFFSSKVTYWFNMIFRFQMSF